MSSAAICQSQPVPEIPVLDVERAQVHYKTFFGFEIGWLSPDKEIGAVSAGECVLFFRARRPPFDAVVHWIFADDVEASYENAKDMGADISDPLETKPWGLRQFTIRDPDGNLFHVYHD